MNEIFDVKNNLQFFIHDCKIKLENMKGENSKNGFELIFRGFGFC